MIRWQGIPLALDYLLQLQHCQRLCPQHGQPCDTAWELTSDLAEDCVVLDAPILLTQVLGLRAARCCRAACLCLCECRMWAEGRHL